MVASKKIIGRTIIPKGIVFTVDEKEAKRLEKRGDAQRICETKLGRRPRVKRDDENVSTDNNVN